ncbi:histidine phosphatase family protein [Aquibacillus salsiterrae]|uniref:Histidine phosphatase family protein n=1 Tax=Aquibacillus salsiterrae TaxID=2950439 RepID=A0A9X3WIC1_9BACI|nr:histidine phosphatase family protein [Aquibacillus salsiterrae]MDC3417919.1 histidine phosphatase family protein [Aquibacillus salsiterrae]
MICLIRHGETDWNLNEKLQGKTDIPLNETGRQQARECRDYFKDTEWDVLVTSPLRRAKETAEIINEGVHVPLVEMEQLKEWSFGKAEGTTKEERDRLYPDKRYPGAETKGQVLERVMEGMKQIVDQYSNKKVLVVAHGAVISLILETISDGQIASKQTRLLNACLNHVEHIDGNWKIHKYNDVSHLSPVSNE